MLMDLTKKTAAFLLGALIVAATFALGAEGPAKMEIKTPSFQTGAEIPRKYTCDGADVSPALAWEGAPAGAKAFALIADDPDAPAGTWVHWVFYDLPGETRALAEAEPATESLPGGAMQGLNDFRKVGYGGPCPPRGPAHRYFFKLYALDAPTNLKPRATKQQLLDAIKGHILAEAELMGRYGR
jgi:Raf kinase inhibitor-like YbhB/YbcL family protein